MNGKGYHSHSKEGNRDDDAKTQEKGVEENSHMYQKHNLSRKVIQI